MILLITMTHQTQSTFDMEFYVTIASVLPVFVLSLAVTGYWAASASGLVRRGRRASSFAMAVLAIALCLFAST
jgi:hypothetical protein